MCLNEDVEATRNALQGIGMDAATLRKLLGCRENTGWKAWSKSIDLDDEHGGGTRVAVHVPPARHSQLGVLMVLHGAGGSGEQILPFFATLGDKLSMAVICPTARQAPHESNSLDFAGIFGRKFQHPHWDLDGRDSTLSALDWARRNLDVDTDRCAVAGVSMGGIATWNLAMRFWHRFSAAIPINGAISAWEMFGRDSRTRALLPNILPLPVFAVHGGKDQQIPPEFDRESFATLRDNGHEDIEYVEVPDGEHGLPTLGLDEGSPLFRRLETWLRGKRRRRRPVAIHHRAVDDRHGRAHWVRISGIRPREVASVRAVRLTSDRIEIQAKGAGQVTLYASGDWLTPGQTITVLVNGTLSLVRFQPDLATVIETYRETADPELVAEQVITFDVS